jgi:hypothetical protein
MATAQDDFITIPISAICDDGADTRGIGRAPVGLPRNGARANASKWTERSDLGVLEPASFERSRRGWKGRTIVGYFRSHSFCFCAVIARAGCAKPPPEAA